MVVFCIILSHWWITTEAADAKHREASGHAPTSKGGAIPVLRHVKRLFDVYRNDDPHARGYAAFYVRAIDVVCKRINVGKDWCRSLRPTATRRMMFSDLALLEEMGQVTEWVYVFLGSPSHAVDMNELSLCRGG
jgi:hypothetical protein